MTRKILWSLAAILLGLTFHLIIILILPLFAIETSWRRISEQNALGQVVVLDQPKAGDANPLGLDPEMTYAICQFDLTEGPGVFAGSLPAGFWSIGIFNKEGISVYSTTNRSGVGDVLSLGIFNAAQTRLLAEQQIEIQEGLLIVETEQNDVFAVLRLAPPHPDLRSRYKAALSNLECGHIDDPSITS